MHKTLRLLIPTIAIILLLTALYSTQIGTENTETKIPILMYHHVVANSEIEENPALAQNGSIISITKFEKQMKYLHDNNYTTISLTDLKKHIVSNKKLPEKPVVITFDDGYESNYTLAFPVLKKYGHKATINIVVKSTQDPKAGHLPHLTWEQMRIMQKSGFITIQSHTYNLHKYLPVDKKGTKKPAAISRIWLDTHQRKETKDEYLKRINSDLKKAKELIEEKLGNNVTVLCFPYGAYNSTLIACAEELGYDTFLTIKKGYNFSDTSLRELKRFGISEKTKMNDFINIVSGNY